MQKIFFNKTTFFGFALSAAIAAVTAYFYGVIFSAGILTAACWMFLNLFFLFKLLAMSIDVRAKHPGRILILSVLKFPAIYLAGYFILKSRVFPMESILIGLSCFLAAMGLSWAISGKLGVRSSEFGVKPNSKNTAPNSNARAVVEEDRSRPADLYKYFMSFFFFSFLSAVCSLQSAVASDPHHSAGHEGTSLHSTNLLGLISHYVPENVAHFLTGIESIFFGVLVILILTGIFYFAGRNIQRVPGRLQSVCEMIVDGLDGFVCGILGPEGRKYTPFLGTLFLYIWTMNLIGLVPLMKSNTANSMTLQGPVALPIPTTTVSLALIVFVTVQGIGIRKQGILGYLDHMAGNPRDAFGWVMAPLMLPIHIIGEFAKPFSLTFRLFCNTMGGHILVAVFIGMGVASMFIPFQAPFLIFEIATSTIQAFVFTLLSTVYIAMMLPHGHDESHDGHGHALEPAHGTH